jgi:ABC-type bacteriocin/lantibiotic exporter with double-glycine peptidase domain
MSAGAVATAVKESKAKYAMAAWLEELARHPTTFKGASGAAFAIERADSLVGHYLAERSKHFRVLLRQYGATLILQAVGVSALLGVGGFLVIGNRLTIGQLIAAELIVTTVLASLTKFSKQLSLFYDLLAAVDKIGYFTDLPLEKSGREPVRSVTGGARVALSNVTFNYEGRPGGVLEGISVTMEAGSRLGITSGTGGGKSTLLDLIYGLRLPVSGAIEYDGQDYRELRLGDLRSQIARVGEPEIFAGTITDNIRLGNAGLSLAGIREALAAVGLLEDVKAFPEGLQTELVTNGLPLSRKQAVRLALARAIAGRPRLLIIDEMLDWLDEPECGQLLDMLFDRQQPWTLLVATRRPEVLARCERIYRLDSGNLLEVRALQEVTQ